MEQVLIKIISAQDGGKIAQAIQYHFSAQDHVRIQDHHTPPKEPIHLVIFIYDATISSGYRASKNHATM